jgi:hypothetical protein
MSVQVKTDLDNRPFILAKMGLIKSAQTVAQDAGRTVDMEYGTVMAYDPSAAKWVPFTDETATDGTQIPKGFLMRKLLTADIVAGDVSDVPILVGDAIVDSAQIVIENSKTLATVVNVPAGLNQTVEDLLRFLGLYPETTIDITETA